MTLSSHKRQHSTSVEAKEACSPPLKKPALALRSCHQGYQSHPITCCVIPDEGHLEHRDCCAVCDNQCEQCSRTICSDHERRCAFCKTPATVYCPNCVNMCKLCKACVCSKHATEHLRFCFPEAELTATPTFCVHKRTLGNDTCAETKTAAFCNGRGMATCDPPPHPRLRLRDVYVPNLIGSIHHCHDSKKRIHIWFTLDVRGAPVAKLLEELKPLPRHRDSKAPCMPCINLYDMKHSRKEWAVVQRMNLPYKQWLIPLRRNWVQSLARGCDTCGLNQDLRYPLFELFETTYIVDVEDTFSELSRTVFPWCYICPAGHVCLCVTDVPTD